ncbi:MAG: helix-turn-helix domain-containing protein [Streptosporangiaceae bacterium]
MASDPYSSPLAYFSAKLKRLRERAGMTQSDVAKQTNYALSTVSAYENGTRIPSADFAKRTDKLFGTQGGLRANQIVMRAILKVCKN